ncbi:sugar ABC transporter ATP-binding protein [Saccharospirillum salsuginis]|uniref:Ribose/galactose/methyl galactoside import ATP-binding protein 2 n=1 Tax=Saccharospirillum salsuginis TaxID=418750 RepID=A0A918KAC5_9GAMM|nr:sugar ABC transporter ATP-binding protein [Saccharospirillum salsuginis]GGX54759.1 putative ribose/galactose/methyl galactoside import ATP-binding protein 2 [Saccharospirillum salsuginis]
MTAQSSLNTQTGDTPLLQLKGVSKSFPGVKALDNVDLDVNAGEVHALLGENGAGKSTLMKVLAGIYHPDEGEIRIEGTPVRMQKPMDAKHMGVLLIHQELSLVPDLSVAENVFLGSLPKRSGLFVNNRELHERCGAILKRLNCRFKSNIPVKHLSVANQQMVEIARALVFTPKVVIFDEPTASLTDYEKVVLFEVIRELKSQGTGIVYISHRMDEIFELSDRITVLRDGQYRGTFATRDTDEEEVTKRMIGRDLESLAEVESPEPGERIIEVHQLGIEGEFRDISFDVHAGEVVGMYGLVGAGRTQVVETLFGIRKPERGTIRIRDELVHLSSPADAIEHGLALVPENRKEQGLVLGMNCRDNTSLPNLAEYTRMGWIDTAKETEVFERYQEQLQIKTPGWYQATLNLSGGNQQKVVIGKWLSTQPSVLILDEPTRGIDVGSKAEIHQLIRDLAKSGLAVIVVSSEMPEILTVSDRILALYNGTLTRVFKRAEITEDDLIRAITGQSADAASEPVASGA